MDESSRRVQWPAAPVSTRYYAVDIAIDGCKKIGTVCRRAAVPKRPNKKWSVAGSQSIALPPGCFDSDQNDQMERYFILSIAQNIRDGSGALLNQ
jgi:hypothetical protein